jgi:hypothetical protein
MAVDMNISNTEWQIYEITLFFDQQDNEDAVVRRIYRYRETKQTLSSASMLAERLRKGGKAIAIFSAPLLPDDEDVHDIFPVVGIHQRGY